MRETIEDMDDEIKLKDKTINFAADKLEVPHGKTIKQKKK